MVWPFGGIEIIPGFFYLCYVANTGAAWSMFAGHGEWLALLAVVALLGIYLFRETLELAKVRYQICFGIMAGGILGNLVDRVLHGHVIDFLDFRFGSYNYPVFNIADSGIFIGVALYMLNSIRDGKREKQA